VEVPACWVGKHDEYNVRNSVDAFGNKGLIVTKKGSSNSYFVARDKDASTLTDKEKKQLWKEEKEHHNEFGIMGLFVQDAGSDVKAVYDGLSCDARKIFWDDSISAGKKLSHEFDQGKPLHAPFHIAYRFLKHVFWDDTTGKLVSFVDHTAGPDLWDGIKKLGHWGKEGVCAVEKVGSQAYKYPRNKFEQSHIEEYEEYQDFLDRNGLQGKNDLSLTQTLNKLVAQGYMTQAKADALRHDPDALWQYKEEARRAHKTWCHTPDTGEIADERNDRAAAVDEAVSTARDHGTGAEVDAQLKAEKAQYGITGPAR
jgi:hypothetical protein